MDLTPGDARQGPGVSTGRIGANAPAGHAKAGVSGGSAEAGVSGGQAEARVPAGHAEAGVSVGSAETGVSVGSEAIAHGSLGARDVCAASVASLLIIFVQLGTSALTMPFAFVNLALSPGLALLANGHLFVLVARRIGRRGPFMILIAFESLAYVLAGYWYEALYLLPLGVAGEALMGKGGYGRLRRIVGLWAAYGFMGAGVNVLPVLAARDAFAGRAVRDGLDPAYVETYFEMFSSLPFVLGAALFGAAMAYAGARSGARLARRHLGPSGLEAACGTEAARAGGEG
jgi:energy-coupling factor transport system substrate-specific component